MEDWRALPEAPLCADGPITTACLNWSLETLPELGRWLQGLPYGRTHDRADYEGVLQARRGTCSTKHALLAAAAAENGQPLTLCLGLYEMDERNTPRVGPALAAAGLASVPEAHCYVRFEGTAIDVTREGTAGTEPITILLEETIAPPQIGDHKLAWHRAQVQRWCVERGLEDPEAVWQAREACIAALTDPDG